MRSEGCADFGPLRLGKADFLELEGSRNDVRSSPEMRPRATRAGGEWGQL